MANRQLLSLSVNSIVVVFVVATIPRALIVPVFEMDRLNWMNVVFAMDLECRARQFHPPVD